MCIYKNLKNATVCMHACVCVHVPVHNLTMKDNRAREKQAGKLGSPKFPAFFWGQSC